MKYHNVTEAEFIERPNRFIAKVKTGGRQETVHVKNTGRCRELLLPGVRVYLSRSENPARKTNYDLIAVERPDGMLFNIDSQAPNAVVKEWLTAQGIRLIRPEYPWGESRIDFYLEHQRADGTKTVLANRDTHPAFADALEEAAAAGVEILCLLCHVEPDRLEITGSLKL